MANIYGMLMDGMRGAQEGADATKKRGLAALVGQTYTAPKEQRQALFGQIATGDPALAAHTQKTMGDWDESKQAALTRSAQLILAAPESSRPQLWAQIVASGEIPGLSPQYDPIKVPEMAQKIVAMGGGTGTAEQQNFAAMTGQFTPEQIMEARMIQAGLKPRAGLLQVGEYAGGVYGVNRDPSKPYAVPVNVSQPGMQQQPTQQARATGEVPFTIDPSLPPEVQASIRANEGQWASAQDGASVPVANRAGQMPQSGQLQGKPQQVSQGEVVRLQLAQEAAQRDQQRLEIAQRAAAQKTPTAGKPLPGNVVTKLTKQAEINDNTAALLGSFTDGYAGNKIGGKAENLLGQLGGEKVGLATPGQADWWQRYDRQKNTVRNELFGSALTPSEQAAFEAADIRPNMAPDKVRSNLRMQAALVAKGLARQAKVWKAQGYNTDAIDAATGPMGAGEGGRQVKRTGTANGRKVIEYTDGTIEYGN